MARAVVAPDDWGPEEPARPREVILAELRQCAEVYLPADDLSWAKRHFRNIWRAATPRFEQMTLDLLPRGTCATL
jgi:hypothetical protein